MTTMESYRAARTQRAREAGTKCGGWSGDERPGFADLGYLESALGSCPNDAELKEFRAAFARARWHDGGAR
jgi:hypothetical protein